MASSPAGLAVRAVLGAAIGLATAGMARPSILSDGFQFPSLDDGVLRQDGDSARAVKPMNIAAQSGGSTANPCRVECVQATIRLADADTRKTMEQ